MGQKTWTLRKREIPIGVTRYFSCILDKPVHRLDASGLVI